MMSHLPTTSECKQTEEALQESEERYRRITDAITDYIYTVRIREGRSEETIHGPACVAVTGYTAEEFKANPYLWIQMVHEEDRKAVKKQAADTLSGVKVEPLEHRIIRKDGAIRWVRNTPVPYYDTHGELLSYDGLIQDVTERKRVEEERRALIVELEAKNAELERFAYTVSHDLKSPLITIRGFLGLLERHMARGDAERIKADIAYISNAAEKMERLLSELLELSRIGRVVNPPEEVSLGKVACEAVSVVAGRATERGVKVEIAPDLPVVYGDPARIREVLENLVDNAVKFMDDHPDPHVEIGARRGDKETVFYVRDNGVGIDPKYHEKVFGLFDRLDQNAEGTGVGLAIVKRIVELHGGGIWVESQGAGQGCTVCFTLSEKSE